MSLKNKKSPEIQKIEKEDFIKFLMSASKEEINNYIISKGKPPKLVNLITRLKGNKKI